MSIETIKTGSGEHEYISIEDVDTDSGTLQINVGDDYFETSVTLDEDEQERLYALLRSRLDVNKTMSISDKIEFSKLLTGHYEMLYAKPVSLWAVIKGFLFGVKS